MARVGEAHDVIELDDGRTAVRFGADGWATRKVGGEWKEQPWRAEVEVRGEVETLAVARRAVDKVQKAKSLARLRLDPKVAHDAATRATLWRDAAVEAVNADPTDPARCPACNYDRRGLPREGDLPPPCPECGHRPDGETLYVFGRDDLHGTDPTAAAGRQRAATWLTVVAAMGVSICSAFDLVKIFPIRLGRNVTILLWSLIGFGFVFGINWFSTRGRKTGGPDLLQLNLDSAAIRVLGIGPTKRSRREVKRWVVQPVDGVPLLWKVVRSGGERFLDTGEFAFYFEASKAAARQVETRLVLLGQK